MSLSSADLTSVRAEADKFLPSSGTILRRTLASDSAGGQTTTYPASGTADCRISPVGGQEVEQGGRIVAEAERIIRFPNGTDVREGDRVNSGGVTYEVLAVPGGDWEIAKPVQVKLLRAQ